MVRVETEGRYRIKLSRFPEESGEVLKAQYASLTVGAETQRKFVPEGTYGVEFYMDLSRGDTRIETLLEWEDGVAGGAQFAEVKLIERY